MKDDGSTITWPRNNQVMRRDIRPKDLMINTTLHYAEATMSVIKIWQLFEQYVRG